MPSQKIRNFFHHPNRILVRKETPDWGPDLSHSSRPQVGRSTRLDSAQVGISKSTWSRFCPSRGNIRMYTLESLRKSRTSCMRLFGIAQNYRVFPGFAAWFREFITLSGLCDTVLCSSKLLSGRCASWGSSLFSHHSSSTQISHTFRVLHRAVAAVMQFFHSPGLACQPNYNFRMRLVQLLHKLSNTIYIL